MASTASNIENRRAWTCLVLAAVTTIVAWWIPARWRSVHPALLRAAGAGSPGLVDTANVGAQRQLLGPATRLNDAARALGLPGTNRLTATLSENPIASPAIAALGGPDPMLAALLPPSVAAATNPASALEVFLPAPRRAAIRTLLSESRSPGIQALLKSEDLPAQQFVPVNQPGGQALDALILMAATLYERERFSPNLARELRELAEQAPHNREALASLEDFYLNLLSLARRLDWTSLAELTRHMPNLKALEEFAAAARAFPNDLSFLYASAMLAGDGGGVARHFTAYGRTGREGLAEGLRQGTGAIRWLNQRAQPVMNGVWQPEFVARAVQREPEVWAWVRVGMFLIAATLVGLSLRAFAQVGIPKAPGKLPMGAGSLCLIIVLLFGFFVIASEPAPPRRQPPPSPKFFLNFAALTKPPAVANSTPVQRKIMEPSTLITLLVFGAIQLAVYVIGLRKINEIVRLPESAAVRLKLLENEENLFDAGLYVGIGGTAAALVMQVMHLLEANLLAAYSSNLMGIIGVALIKIGHVRLARRRLILESQAEAAEFAADAVAGAAPAANPFVSR